MRYKRQHVAVLRTTLDGTKRAVWLLLAGGSNTAGSGQQYCWLEAAIAKQALLYRLTGISVPSGTPCCTVKQATQCSQTDSIVSLIYIDIKKKLRQNRSLLFPLLLRYERSGTVKRGRDGDDAPLLVEGQAIDAHLAVDAGLMVEEVLVDAVIDDVPLVLAGRSEERRVGKECRSRWSPYH